MKNFIYYIIVKLNKKRNSYDHHINANNDSKKIIPQIKPSLSFKLINNNYKTKKIRDNNIKTIFPTKKEKNNLNNSKNSNSINLIFKSLKERNIISKNKDMFLRDSNFRLKDQKVKDVIKIKIEKYKKIFNLIDRNQKGVISIKNLNLSVIDNEELIFLTPVLIELQKHRKTMDFKEFCIKIDRSLTSKVFVED